MILESALVCLALNVYHEARGENIPGQYAVAMVTMNRAKWDDSKVCKEVTKPRQFSWVNSRMVSHQSGKPRLKARAEPKEVEAWERSKIIAKVVLDRKMASDITNGSTFYHSVKVSPSWAKEFAWTKQIGLHHFYAALSVTHDYNTAMIQSREKA